MQPYFFPYIGYWQLLHYADILVLLDDVQYIRHGWVNRNRILKPNEGWQYIIVPLEKHSLKSKIKDIISRSCVDWRAKIYAQLEHYKKIAPYYKSAMDIVHESIYGENYHKISNINFHIIKTVSSIFGMKKDVIISSDKMFDYSCVADPGEWALRISEQLGASEYINPVSGAPLFDSHKFLDANIKLSFIKPLEIEYDQKRMFIPSLSIIDVIMFNGLEKTKDILKQYQIIET